MRAIVHSESWNGAGAVRPGAVLVVDDHPMVRSGLAALLSAEGRWRTLEAGGIDDALQALDTHADDIGLVLYDWHLRGSGGCEGLRSIRRRAPRLPVVVMSGDDNDAIPAAASRIGACAFLSKCAEPHDIARTLAPWVGRTLLAPDADGAAAGHAADPAPDDAAAGAEAPCLAALTARQREILRLVALGWPDKRIADELNIAWATVRAHVSDVLHLLGVHNRTEAALKAARLGVVAPPPRRPSAD